MSQVKMDNAMIVGLRVFWEWCLQGEDVRPLWVYSLISYFVEKLSKVQYNFVTTKHRIDLDVSKTTG